jgi:hypothetical protein
MFKKINIVQSKSSFGQDIQNFNFFLAKSSYASNGYITMVNKQKALTTRVLTPELIMYE